MNIRKTRKKLRVVETSLTSAEKWNKQSVSFLKNVKRGLEIEIANKKFEKENVKNI